MELDVQNQYKEDIPLSNHPNFSRLGYRVIQELGSNRQSGRITYLAQVLKSEQKVVIKEFHHANISADLSGLKAHEREIAILKQLNHSRIPRYVDYFETPAGFYLVQEYKNAPSLGIKRCFHPEEIKQIAVSVLEILVYLQRRISPIIHRDIKPENILVDERLNAYLVDFGLAQSQGTKIHLSSFIAGTPGFMPPEEQLGHPLTEASDLYSLGATLICLLTRTRSVDVGKLVDDQQRFNFQNSLPQISPRLRLWLMKMVEHNRKHRYANAALALEALKPIQVLGVGMEREILAAAVRRKKQAAVLGLVTIGTLTAVGATWMMTQPGGFTKQILEAQECLGANLLSNCQDKTGH